MTEKKEFYTKKELLKLGCIASIDKLNYIKSLIENILKEKSLHNLLLIKMTQDIFNDFNLIYGIISNIYNILGKLEIRINDINFEEIKKYIQDILYNIMIAIEKKDFLHLKDLLEKELLVYIDYFKEYFELIEKENLKEIEISNKIEKEKFKIFTEGKQILFVIQNNINQYHKEENNQKAMDNNIKVAQFFIQNSQKILVNLNNEIIHSVKYILNFLENCQYAYDLIVKQIKDENILMKIQSLIQGILGMFYNNFSQLVFLLKDYGELKLFLDTLQIDVDKILMTTDFNTNKLINERFPETKNKNKNEHQKIFDINEIKDNQ